MLYESQKMKKFIIKIVENIYFIKFLYYLSIIHNFYYIHIKKNNNNESKLRNQLVKSVAFVNSSVHFNPYSLNPKINNSGTANWAENIWNLLSTIDSKDFYCIYRDYKIKNKKYDLIIGFPSKIFVKLCNHNVYATKILIAVNCHPIFRLKQFIEEAKDLKLYSIERSEIADPFIMNKSIFYSSKIILTGNHVIKKTFTNLGIKDDKIQSISGGLNYEIFYNKEIRKYDCEIIFFFPSAYRGLRKGYVRLLKFWSSIEKNNPSLNIMLFILGKKDKKIEHKFRRLISSLNKVKYINDYISEKKLIEYYNKSHFVILPSLDEGEVHGIIEGMACGAIPIISKFCGLNINHQEHGLLLDDFKNTEKNTKLVSDMVKDKKKLKLMSDVSVKFIKNNNQWKKFDKIFVKALGRPIE